MRPFNPYRQPRPIVGREEARITDLLDGFTEGGAELRAECLADLLALGIDPTVPDDKPEWMEPWD